MTEEGQQSIVQEVERRTTELLDEYAVYCHNEDADPDAYIERMEALLDEMRQAPERNEVMIQAVTAFLARAERPDAKWDQ